MTRGASSRARRILRRAEHRRRREDREVVQLRPAWADSVLLCWGSPVAYEDSELEDELVTALEAWDTSCYDQLAAEPDMPSQTFDADHRSEGIRLAQQVSDALGSAFTVEFDEYSVRSRHRPTSPVAATAFSLHAGERKAELQRLLTGRGHDAGSDERCGTSDDGLPGAPGRWLRDVRAQTTRRVRVLVSPDLYVGFPVEVVADGRAGYVGADMLGISAQLRHDLEDFQDWWELHASDDDEPVKPDEETEWNVCGDERDPDSSSVCSPNWARTTSSAGADQESTHPVTTAGPALDASRSLTLLEPLRTRVVQRAPHDGRSACTARRSSSVHSTTVAQRAQQ